MAVGSFSAGLSGLNANSTYLSVIGNNLANINTVGFKTSAVSFATWSARRSAAPASTRRRSASASSPARSRRCSPRARSRTRARPPTSPSRAPASSRSATARSVGYTRAGNFSFDDNGMLITPDGWRVQGYTQTDPVTGNIITAVAPNDIIIPPGVLRAPTATTNVRAQVNLDPNVAHRSGEPRVHDVDPDVRRARQPARADRRLQPHRRRRVDLHGHRAAGRRHRRRRRAGHADDGQPDVQRRRRADRARRRHHDSRARPRGPTARRRTRSPGTSSRRSAPARS